MGVHASELGWQDGWWRSADGLTLHYRDYPGDPARAPVLCIPGLTRNARDFARLAMELAGTRRVIVVELRGRGKSERSADPMTYVPPVYLRDVALLLGELALPKVAIFGTSLGGLLAMLLAATEPHLLAGVLLNDIGPVIEPAGLARIRSYVGGDARWSGWQEAALAQAAVHGPAYPLYSDGDWRAMAERLCVADPEVGITTDYDPAIALPFDVPAPDPPLDLWPAFQALAGLPGLIVRGAISDILSMATADEMVRRVPSFDLVTVPATGHAPTLDEPEATEAIHHLLARIDRVQ
jgi:pimeloyl-ACP methyl ester carboxylesterase